MCCVVETIYDRVKQSANPWVRWVNLFMILYFFLFQPRTKYFRESLKNEEKNDIADPFFEIL